MVDKAYCMSSYLMYRYIFNEEYSFQREKKCRIADISFPRAPVRTAEELLGALEREMKAACADGKAVLALSGGIDSAILAKFMPKGSKAYTFRCLVPGRQVTDESAQAAKWAGDCGLDHEILDIRWEDVVSAAETLMLRKGAPIHSIETQIYLAAQMAGKAGARKFIFGENADILYGGMDGLLQKDWTYGEFVDRYTYIMPYRVLRNPRLILEPYLEYEKDGHIDGHAFLNQYFRQEALGAYRNACETAGIEFIGPYSMTYLDAPIDYARIRNGEPKYLVREAFRILYPGESLPEKIPMPRPTDEWLAGWEGPKRPEFIPHAADSMTGDQRWMVWALERYLNLIENC